ncbi:MAG: hypothetical protein R3B91_15500 [Planctomycetaceae bacterium]
MSGLTSSEPATRRADVERYPQTVPCRINIIDRSRFTLMNEDLRTVILLDLPGVPNVVDMLMRKDDPFDVSRGKSLFS